MQVAPVPSCIAGTVLLIVDWQKSPDRLRSLVLVAPELVVERELLRSDRQRARRDTGRKDGAAQADPDRTTGGGVLKRVYDDKAN